MHVLVSSFHGSGSHSDPSAHAEHSAAVVETAGEALLASPFGGHAGAHGGLAGMCLAVVGALVLLLAHTRSGRGHRVGRTSTHPWHVVVVRARALGPAPPDLHALCIARC